MEDGAAELLEGSADDGGVAPEQQREGERLDVGEVLRGVEPRENGPHCVRAEPEGTETWWGTCGCGRGARHGIGHLAHHQTFQRGQHTHHVHHRCGRCGVPVQITRQY